MHARAMVPMKGKYQFISDHNAEKSPYSEQTGRWGLAFLKWNTDLGILTIPTTTYEFK